MLQSIPGSASSRQLQQEPAQQCLGAQPTRATPSWQVQHTTRASSRSSFPRSPAHPRPLPSGGASASCATP